MLAAKAEKILGAFYVYGAVVAPMLLVTTGAELISGGCVGLGYPVLGPEGLEMDKAEPPAERSILANFLWLRKY